MTNDYIFFRLFLEKIDTNQASGIARWVEFLFHIIHAYSNISYTCQNVH